MARFCYAALSLAVFSRSALSDSRGGLRKVEEVEELWQFDSRRGVVPELEGASCSDPPEGFPSFCCLRTHKRKFRAKPGIPTPTPESDVNPKTAGTCECNPAWTSRQCMCHTSYMERPCHACMVHLPAANRWATYEKSDDELYSMCGDCVSRCLDKLRDGPCSNEVDGILERHFPGHEDVKEEICNHEYFKQKLQDKNYPLGMKRALYMKPGVDEYANDVRAEEYNWKVPGVGHYSNPAERASAGAKKEMKAALR